MKAVMIFGLIMALVGAGPVQGQTPAEEYKNNLATAVKNMKGCMESARNNNPVYERLKQIFVLAANDGRQDDKLSDNRYVTPQTAADYEKFREMTQPCRDNALNDYARVDPRFVEYIASMYAESDENLLGLLRKDLTVGERNKFIVENSERFNRRMSEIDREITAEFNK